MLCNGLPLSCLHVMMFSLSWISMCSHGKDCSLVMAGWRCSALASQNPSSCVACAPIEACLKW